jgi:arabinogalactan oligomer/maltooligosaccharide transport system permease protein
MISLFSWIKGNAWRHAVAWICVIFAVFPLYLVVLSAFNSSPSLQSTSFIPRTFVWDNFAVLFTDPTVPYLKWMMNSAIIAGSVSLVSVAIGAASAFGFSRLRFKGKRTGLQALLLIQMFPSVLALSAIYVIMERVHVFAPEWGLGTAGGLVLVYLGGSMGVNIWLMKGFVDSIPLELDEAAKVDGASAMQTYWQIFLPLATPILAVVTLLSFIGLFNEYVMARLFLPDVESRTVAVGLQFFIGGQYSAYWGPFAAGSLLASIPIIIVFMSLQRYIIGGLTAGSVKG